MNGDVVGATYVSVAENASKRILYIDAFSDMKFIKAQIKQIYQLSVKIDIRKIYQ